MDKRKIALLKYLLENSKEGYKVFEINKLLSVSKKYKGKYAELESDINYLKDRNYIDVKYIDEDSVCLSTLNNSRIVEDNITVEHKSNRKFIVVMLLSMIFSGIMAFVGAAVAVLLFR